MKEFLTQPVPAWVILVWATLSAAWRLWVNSRLFHIERIIGVRYPDGTPRRVRDAYPTLPPEA